MMKNFCIISLLLLFGYLHTALPACEQRDEARAKADDPTRICRKACNTNSDCPGALKQCHCDGLCGATCFNRDAECDNITGTLDNGMISFLHKSLKYNTEASHSCNKGYALRGVSARTCRSNRKWSHEAPTCIRSCSFPARIGNSYLDSRTERDVYEAGVTVTYKCQSGRNPVGNPNVTCQSSYEWSTLKLDCPLKNCGTPPSITDGDYTPKTKTTFATRVTYFCNKGFQTTDLKVTSLCRSTGRWDNKAPTCTRVQCAPPPKQHKNGKILENGGSSPWEYEDSIDIQCDDGFLIDGKVSKTTVRCNEKGTWGEMPPCEGDLNADFNRELEGYATVSGTFNRKGYSTDVGVPDYGVFGSGVFRSVPYPIPASGKACIQTDVITDSMIAQAFTVGATINLKTFKPTGGWKTKIFWLITPVVNQTEVQLQFTALMNSWIDNIKVLPDSQCATEAEPKRTVPPQPASSTKSPPITKDKDSSTTTQSVILTSRSSSMTTQTSSMTTQSSTITTPPTSIDETTGGVTSAAKSPSSAPTVQTLPGRNGRPGNELTTNQILTTKATSNTLRDTMIALGCVIVVAVAALIIYKCYTGKDKPGNCRYCPGNTGSDANLTTTAASNSSPSSRDGLTATETV